MAAGQPPTSRCWPRALTPILRSSPSLPHCDRSAPPAFSVPLPFSSGQGTWESVHPCSDPSLPPPQPAPLARDLAPEELLRGLDVRAASPGREPRAASRPSTGLPLSARMPPVTGSSLSPGAARSGLAHRAALPSPPLLSASASAARAAPRPLCPQLPLSPLLPLWNSEPPITVGSTLGSLSLS